MKHNTINKLLLALPGLILSTSILSAFSLLAFCMRSIPMALLLVGISAFGWSGILAAITKFYDKLMNIWQTKSYPLFIGSWMLLSFLVSMSFGFEKSSIINQLYMFPNLIDKRFLLCVNVSRHKYKGLRLFQRNDVS